MTEDRGIVFAWAAISAGISGLITRDSSTRGRAGKAVEPPANATRPGKAPEGSRKRGQHDDPPHQSKNEPALETDWFLVHGRSRADDRRSDNSATRIERRRYRRNRTVRRPDRRPTERRSRRDRIRNDHLADGPDRNEQTRHRELGGLGNRDPARHRRTPSPTVPRQSPRLLAGSRHRRPRNRSVGRRKTARSLRRRTFAARNGSPAHDLSPVSGRLRRSAWRGGFSVVGEQKVEFGPRGPHGPPETAVRVDLPPLRAAFPASYAAISTCSRLTFNAKHTKSHSHRTFASPRRLKRRKPSTCLIQP